MSGRRLAAILAAIALFALVLPPLAAQQVHRRRIDRATQFVATMATALGAEGSAALAAAAGMRGGDAFVLAGEGAVPVFLGAAGWPADRMVPLRTVVQRLSSRSIPGARNVIADSPDPWGNQYLIVVGGAAPGMSVAVICAGPDGIIETPFGIVATRGGDDIMSVR